MSYVITAVYCVSEYQLRFKILLTYVMLVSYLSSYQLILN